MNPTDLPDLSKPICSVSNRGKTKIVRNQHFRKTEKCQRLLIVYRTLAIAHVAHFELPGPVDHGRGYVRGVQKSSISNGLCSLVLVFCPDVLFFYYFSIILVFRVDFLFFSYFSISLFLCSFHVFLFFLLLNASHLFSSWC